MCIHVCVCVCVHTRGTTFISPSTFLSPGEMGRLCSKWDVSRSDALIKNEHVFSTRPIPVCQQHLENPEQDSEVLDDGQVVR